LEEKNWQGNMCALAGVSLLGAAGVAAAFMRG